MAIQLLNYNNEELKKENLIGFMRFDFADGRLANSWVAGDIFNDYAKENKITILQDELNDILFNHLDTFEKVGDLVDATKCSFEFTANDTKFYYAETEKHVFFIRLMPSDINKIFAYKK